MILEHDAGMSENDGKQSKCDGLSHVPPNNLIIGWWKSYSAHVFTVKSGYKQLVNWLKLADHSWTERIVGPRL